ncbi:diguanylate cyclase [Desulfovibrio desulfuricans]|nr:diguanylate cyclase [Desulfovibrio desulfuricans]MCQ4859706.1 diguanylate cyclase [Desulfovibrio desulfuricans]
MVMNKHRLMSIFRFDTIRGRIRAYTIAIVCIPITIAALFFIFFQQERLIENEKKQLAEILGQNKNTIKAYVDVCFQDVLFLTKVIKAHRSDMESAAKEFSDYDESHTGISAAVFVNAQGISEIDSMGKPGLYGGDRYYFKQAMMGLSAITTGIKGRVSGKPVCMFSMPVTNQAGEFDGVVFLSILVGELDAWLHGSFVPDKQGLILCDAQGNILAPHRAVASNADDAAKQIPLQLMQLGEAGQIFVNDQGVRMLGASVAVGHGGWRLVYFRSVDEILAGYRWLTIFVGLGSLCAVLFMMPLMLRFCRSIEAPLEELTAYALELRKNNYEATGQLCDQKNMPSELRILFDAFTVMSFRVARQIKKAEAVSLKDALTGLHNRRFLQAMGAEFLKKTHSAGQQCACLMLDIDHFKSINDTFGHNVGDMVLQHTARIINASVRSADLLVRYGGEEFVVLVACKDARQGEELAHRIRHAVAAHPLLSDGNELSVTISIGVAVCADMADMAESPESAEAALAVMLIRADKALYAAKEAGRDAVVVAA